jgi:hypothetical protein
VDRVRVELPERLLESLLKLLRLPTPRAPRQVEHPVEQHCRVRQAHRYGQPCADEVDVAVAGWDWSRHEPECRTSVEPSQVRLVRSSPIAMAEGTPKDLYCQRRHPLPLSREDVAQTAAGQISLWGGNNGPLSQEVKSVPAWPSKAPRLPYMTSVKIASRCDCERWTPLFLCATASRDGKSAHRRGV